MDPWTAALLVLVFGLMMTTMGVVLMAVAHFGCMGRHLMARGLAAILYGAWGLLVGGTLVALTEIDVPALLVGGIVGVTGLLMVWAYRWVVDAAWAMLS